MCKAHAYGARAWLANQQNPGAYGVPGVVERSGVKGTTVVTVTLYKLGLRRLGMTLSNSLDRD